MQKVRQHLVADTAQDQHVKQQQANACSAQSATAQMCRWQQAAQNQHASTAAIQSVVDRVDGYSIRNSNRCCDIMDIFFISLFLGDY